MKLSYAKIHTVKADLAKRVLNIALTTNWTDEAYATSKRLGVFAGENERLAITFERVEDDQLPLIPPEFADMPMPEHITHDHSTFCHICDQALNLQGPWDDGHDLALRMFATDHAHADMAQAWIDDMARIAVGAQRAAPSLVVVDRPAAIGDVVLLDAIGRVGESVLMENLDWELLLRADDGEGMFPGFTAAIVGLAAGESKTFILSFPEDDPNDYSGPEATFDVTVKEVRAVSDDEPAQPSDLSEPSDPSEPPAADENATPVGARRAVPSDAAPDEDLTPEQLAELNPATP